MPELPEVENLRRGLVAKVVGQRILKVVVKKPKLVSGKGNIRKASSSKMREFTNGLTGECITAIERRAKNLIFRTEGGRILLVHLKMSGQFIYEERGRRLVDGGHPIELSEKELPNKHTHVIFELERGILYYNDTRMFGYLLFYPDAVSFENANHFGGLGLEPLSRAFTPKYFHNALKQKKGVLKIVLMGQGIVVGLGNIYADEVCFLAGVRPTRRVETLKPAEIEALFKAIKFILPRSVKLGGSSVATYRLLDDSRGNFAREHKVYGKTGERCSVCDTKLRTLQLNGRTTVFCPRCQH